jgi:YidC/Oxa1 family membrane protein insertase
MILAIVLSALVLLGWTLLSDRFLPEPAPQAQKVDNTQTNAAQPEGQPQAGPVAESPQKLQPRAQVIGATPRVEMRTPSLRGSINLKGARIDDLVLLKERQTIEENSPPVRLLSPAGAPDAYFASFGWTAEGVQLPGPNTVWTASAPVLQPGQPVTLSWTNPTGQTFQLIVSVDKNYLFNVRQRIVNRGSSPIAVRPYGLISRAEMSDDPSRWTVHVGPMAYLDGEAEYDVDWDDLDGGKVKQ